ncbi:MAG: hypothetical protein ACO3WO_03500 [Burkholderiaceae bacterium]|jgi:hypothetical protein
MKVERFAGFVGLMLLVAFFVPYVVKVQQLDILIILLGGIVLAVVDFLTTKH